MTHPPMHFADRTLARRLERAEGASNAAFVESRARHAPASGAAWCEIAGAYAMFDGVGSPITQTFGLGLFADASADDLARIESFFRERGADVHHEVSPMADPALLAVLAERGYRPMELTSVMHRPLVPDDLAPPPRAVRARRIEPGEEDVWARTAARGWSETPGLEAFMMDFGVISAHSRGTECFLAELDGEPIAAAALTMHGGVALLAGASTIPERRGRGAQAALLEARLARAAAQGCDLAMLCAAPGSTSQRNGERRGFRIAYTRIKWHQPRPV